MFSSSCTVYGEPERIPIDEECSQNSTTSPYGRTKVFNETILQDMCAAAPEMNVCLLRYFNPVAAHPSGLIGEHPIGVPANLMPFVQQVRILHHPDHTHHITTFSCFLFGANSSYLAPCRSLEAGFDCSSRNGSCFIVSRVCIAMERLTERTQYRAAVCACLYL